MKRTKYIITGIIVLLLIVFLGYTAVLINQPQKKQLQGEVEAKQVKVSSKLIGRIDKLHVRNGNDVKKGTVLFTIDSPEVNAKLNQAEAGRAAALAQNEKANEGARKEDIQIAYNTYMKAKAAKEYAEITYNRIKNLSEQGVLPQQKLDDITVKYKAAQESENAAKALWQKAKTGARSQDKKAAEALVSKADAMIEEVKSYLNETKIKAPIDGEVVDIIAEEGELIPSGFPVLSIVDLNDIWANIQVKEIQLKYFKKGSEFKASVPALEKKDVVFKVNYVSVLGDYATWNATKARGEFDIKTFKIQARPKKPLKGFRPGMSILIDMDQFK